MPTLSMTVLVCIVYRDLVRRRRESVEVVRSYSDIQAVRKKPGPNKEKPQE
jgi:hypothetical protein